LIILTSSSALPTICIPRGKPFCIPAGTDIAGSPARLAGIVNTSFKYIATGLSFFSLKPKAGVGAVGRSIASALSKPLLNSLDIILLTFWALV
jgi:hypothetical protein